MWSADSSLDRCPSELLRTAKNSETGCILRDAKKIFSEERSSDGLSRRGTSWIIRPTETIIIIISTSSLWNVSKPFFFYYFSFACSSSVVLFFHSSLITHFRWASASMSWCWWERISFVSIPKKSRVFCCRARSEFEEKYFGWTLFVFGVSLSLGSTTCDFHLRIIYGIVCVNMISLIYWKRLQNWAICWLSELSSFSFSSPTQSLGIPVHLIEVNFYI